MDFSQFTEAILKLIFTAFLVERSLSLFFEQRWFIQKTKSRPNIRSFIALFYSMLFVYATDLNIVYFIERDSLTGDELERCIKSIILLFITAAFVAGGSKASLKLFRDVMKIRSMDERMRTHSSLDEPVSHVLTQQAASDDESIAQNARRELHDRILAFQQQQEQTNTN